MRAVQCPYPWELDEAHSGKEEKKPWKLKPTAPGTSYCHQVRKWCSDELIDKAKQNKTTPKNTNKRKTKARPCRNNPLTSLPALQSPPNTSTGRTFRKQP